MRFDQLARLVSTVLVGAGVGLVAVSPAHAEAVGAVPRHLTPLVSALRAETATAEADRVTLAGWRAELAPMLARLGDRTVTGALRGRVLADTLYLPARLVITGDTTIVARRLVFAGAPARITTGGHALHVYPVSAVVLPGHAKPGAGINADVVIDASGQPGAEGSYGAAGTFGWSGTGGANGWPGYYPYCWGENGGQGWWGSDGGAGNEGGGGSDGWGAGEITFDIPDGDFRTYDFIATGGAGGSGGHGGQGGPGGVGGWGGNGGSANDFSCAGFGSGGNGGNGGDGATGGAGGSGGPGGNGGPGGYISVTYPGGYPREWINTRAQGGTAGAAGGQGPGGNGGLGGAGGMGGHGGGDPFGNDGMPGIPGMNGAAGATGSPGPAGQPGPNGQVRVNRR